MSKIIMHIDLNAFFATCEQIKDPSLIGKPLIVGGEGRSGIVSTCSYEARKFGVHSGMPTFQAKILCPDIIIRPVDFHYYHLMSQEFFVFVRKYSKIIEKASVDECYADMSKTLSGVKDVYSYLKNMQLELFKKTGLKCSIGIAPTKFLAKMASDLKKPMGLTIIRRRDIKDILYPLPIKDFWGIGKKTAPRLEAVGVKTIGDLANKIDNGDKEVEEILGKFIEVVKDWIHGYGSDTVDTEPWDPKSIGNSSTLMHDTDDYEIVKSLLSSLAKSVSDRAKSDGKKGTTIQLVVKDVEFKTHNKSTSFDVPTNDYEFIFLKAMNLYEKNFVGMMIRLAGITLQNLVDPRDVTEQISLFDSYVEKDSTKLLISELNKRLEKPLIMRASEIRKRKKE